MTMTTAARPRTADDLARMFAERLGAHGGFISVKQAAWLTDVFRREIAHIYDPRMEPQGWLCEVCHAGWQLHIRRNGAGHLRLGTCAHRVCRVAGCSCQTGTRSAGCHLDSQRCPLGHRPVPT